MKDVSFGLPPLTDQDAYRMIRAIRTYPLLAGVRGEPPRDVDALAEAILRFAQLVLDFDQIAEIDLNPIESLEQGKGYRAVDARVILVPPGGSA
jgi:acyl-CoA synthetase (NDP forming)